MEQARKHLERRSFSSAIRAEKANNLALCDFKVYFLDGFNVFVLAFKKATYCRAKSAFAFRYLVRLAQIIHLNGFWGHKIAPPVKSDFIISRTEVLEINLERRHSIPDIHVHMNCLAVLDVHVQDRFIGSRGA